MFPMMENMTHPQESRVSSTQDSLRLYKESFPMDQLHSLSGALPPPLVNKCNARLVKGKIATTSQIPYMKKMESIFPWVKGFNESCRKLIGNGDSKVLENHLTVYLKHISIDVENCYKKPNRASKLKGCMSQMLLFFHLFYQEVKEPLEHRCYLGKLTDLMAMYLDMEIIASRRKKEITTKVISRLTSSLYIFLDHSYSDMMDVILKAKLIHCRTNQEICVPILRKLLTDLQITTLDDDMLYVRYLLVFKLWRKFGKDLEEKQRIVDMAAKKLSVPTNFLEKSKVLADGVLPRVPRSRTNITVFFMEAKVNLVKSCKAFLKLCEAARSSEKSMYFGHLGSAVSAAGNKNDVGGERTNCLLNTIWSSLSDSKETEMDSSEVNQELLQAMRKQKSQEKLGKKMKNKLNAGKKVTDRLEKKNKKKEKKCKNKLVPDDALSMPDSVTAEIIPLAVAGSENVSNTNLNGKETNESVKVENALNGQQEAVVKTENHVQDLRNVARDVAKEVNRDRWHQVNEINSVGNAGDIVPERENLEGNVQIPNAVILSAPGVYGVPYSLEQVNQINGLFCDSEYVQSLVLGQTDNSEPLRVYFRLGEPPVIDTERVNGGTETNVGQFSSSATFSNVEIPMTCVNRTTASNVSSSNVNSSVDCLINSSHSQATGITLNEAVPASVCQGAVDTTSIDMAALRIDHSNLLVSPICGEEISVTSNVCDSSIEKVFVQEGAKGESERNLERLNSSAVSGIVGMPMVCVNRTTVVPESSNSVKSSVDYLVGSSHRQTTGITVNESVPACLVQNTVDTSSTDILAPRMAGSDILLSQMRGQEASNTIPPTATSNVHESSVEKVLIQEGAANNVSNQEQGHGVVDNEYSTWCYPDIDEDEDLRLVGLGGHIFGTKHGEITWDALENLSRGNRINPNVELDMKVLCSEDGIVESSSYTELMASDLKKTRNQELLTHLETDEPFIRGNSGKMLLSGSSDGMETVQYTSDPSMNREEEVEEEGKEEEDEEEEVEEEEEDEEEEDEDDDVSDASVSPSSSPLSKLVGSVGSHSSSNSPTCLKNVFITNGNSYRREHSDISSLSSRDSQKHPQVGVKTPAPVFCTSLEDTPLSALAAATDLSDTNTSKLKKSNVNRRKCEKGPPLKKQKKSGHVKDSKNYPDLIRDTHKAKVKGPKVNPDTSRTPTAHGKPSGRKRGRPKRRVGVTTRQGSRQCNSSKNKQADVSNRARTRGSTQHDFTPLVSEKSETTKRKKKKRKA